MRKKNEHLLDVIKSNRRIVVSSDLYNWIVKYGSVKTSDKVFNKNAHFWYFTDIESMLTYLFKILLRLKLRSLELIDIIDAINSAKQDVIEIGIAIDKKLGVQYGCK